MPSKRIFILTPKQPPSYKLHEVIPTIEDLSIYEKELMLRAVYGIPADIPLVKNSLTINE